MNKEIEKIFVELIQTSLDLPNDYGTDPQGNVIPCVTIKSQNIKLFNTPKLQITVSTLSNKVYACRKEYFERVINEDQVEYCERQMLNDQRTMQIDVYSRNNEARQRFWEVQACLGSTLAEELANKYQFRIGKISNSFNTSGLDGGSDINRYTIRFNCLSWYEKIIPIRYYEIFRTTAQHGYPPSTIFADFTIRKEED